MLWVKPEMNGTQDDRKTQRITGVLYLGRLDLEIRYRQLSARRASLQFKHFPMRVRRVLLLYKVYGNRSLLAINGTSLNCNDALLALN